MVGQKMGEATIVSALFTAFIYFCIHSVSELKVSWAREKIMREALEKISVNSVPGGHDQTIAKEALAKCAEGKMK